MHETILRVAALFGLLCGFIGSSRAQSDLLQGTWALGGSCKGFLYELRITGDLWQFTDAKGRIAVERLLRSEQGTYLTETVSGGDFPRGTRWLYTFRTDGSAADVRNLGSGRSFGLTRCSEPAVAATPRPQPPAAPPPGPASTGTMIEQSARPMEQPFNSSR